MRRTWVSSLSHAQLPKLTFCSLYTADLVRSRSQTFRRLLKARDRQPVLRSCVSKRLVGYVSSVKTLQHFSTQPSVHDIAAYVRDGHECDKKIVTGFVLSLQIAAAGSMPPAANAPYTIGSPLADERHLPWNALSECRRADERSRKAGGVAIQHSTSADSDLCGPAPEDPSTEARRMGSI